LWVGSVSIDKAGDTLAMGGGGHPIEDEATASAGGSNNNKIVDKPVVRIFRLTAGNWEERGSGIVVGGF
jgi:hypothetical protein